MPTLSPRDIYEVALAAGFTPDQAVTWTAIALAESSGRTTAHASQGEDSWGLWQINVAPKVRANTWGDLTDPAVNARAAYEISKRGTDMRPWTVTHDKSRGTAHDYRTYLPEVEAIAGGGYDRIDAGVALAAADTDQDGLTDDFERLVGLDAAQADTDADGLSDSFEVLQTHTDPMSADTDSDQVSDALEYAAKTDAGMRDSDRDGLADLTERLAGSDPAVADTDRDGLSDAMEVALGTNPANVDSDADGLTDAAEVRFGSNPLQPGLGGGAPQSTPAPPASPSFMSAQSPPSQFVARPVSADVSALGSASAPDTGAGIGSPASGSAGPALKQFLDSALAQTGDSYIFGTEPDIDNPNPNSFDCSELTQWAAHRAGVEIPDGAMYQYLDLKAKGMLIPVEQAINTPGALLFSFSTEPRPGGGRPSSAHVAISLGDGKTIEARGRAYGVGSFSAQNRFEWAAVIPGISDGEGGGYDRIDAGVALAAADTDQDGLTDDFERLVGLDAAQADTDADGLSDSFEVLQTHTDPMSADTDSDQVSDALEYAAKTDAGMRDSDRDGLADLTERLAGSDPAVADTDRDGLSDAMEVALGTNPANVDSDADGLTDAAEVRFGSNPLQPGLGTGIPQAAESILGARLGSASTTGESGNSDSSGDAAGDMDWSTGAD